MTIGGGMGTKAEHRVNAVTRKGKDDTPPGACEFEE